MVQTQIRRVFSRIRVEIRLVLSPAVTVISSGDDYDHGWLSISSTAGVRITLISGLSREKTPQIEAVKVFPRILSEFSRPRTNPTQPVSSSQRGGAAGPACTAGGWQGGAERMADGWCTIESDPGERSSSGAGGDGGGGGAGVGCAIANHGLRA